MILWRVDDDERRRRGSTDAAGGHERPAEPGRRLGLSENRGPAAVALVPGDDGDGAVASPELRAATPGVVVGAVSPVRGVRLRRQPRSASGVASGVASGSVPHRAAAADPAAPVAETTGETARHRPPEGAGEQRREVETRGEKGS